MADTIALTEVPQGDIVMAFNEDIVTPWRGEGDRAAVGLGRVPCPRVASGPTWRV
jgi:hypothetical protein